jgi:hypothetical protein
MLRGSDTLNVKWQGETYVMDMNECRKRVQAIDKQMLYLASHGVTGPADILEHMAGQMPVLHRIWTDVSDGQLVELAAEFPGFRALAVLTEAAWLAEQRKPSRSYDDMPVFSDRYRQWVSSTLTRGAELEHDWQRCRKGGDVDGTPELQQLCRAWKQDVQDLLATLKADAQILPSQRACVAAVLLPMMDRIASPYALQNGGSQK